MGKKLTLALMLVVALLLIAPLTGATMYAEDRPAVTAPLSVVLESNIDATDMVLVYRATLGSIVELEAPSACGVSGSMVLPIVTTTAREYTNAFPERRVLLLWRHLTSSQRSRALASIR